MKRVGISLVEVYERVGTSVILVSKTTGLPSSRYECVRIFSHKRVGVALQATVKTLYEK